MKETKLFVMGCVSALVVFPLLSLFGIKYSTLRNGSHTGYVTAIEQEGFIFKNYTVYFKTDTSSSQEDLYCVRASDNELASKLRKISKEKLKVTINFVGVTGIGLGQCHTYQIKSVDTE